MGLVIAEEDPRTGDVVELLERHLAHNRAASPPEHVHALDLEGLLDPSVTLFAARDEGRVVALGALKELEAAHGEVKSMHTLEQWRGRGVGRAVLQHLLAVAEVRGYRRVSLETGTMDAFAPARALYASVGFVSCRPFARYTTNPYSTCMTLALPTRAPSIDGRSTPEN